MNIIIKTPIEGHDCKAKVKFHLEYHKYDTVTTQIFWRYNLWLGFAIVFMSECVCCQAIGLKSPDLLSHIKYGLLETRLRELKLTILNMKTTVYHTMLARMSKYIYFHWNIAIHIHVHVQYSLSKFRHLHHQPSHTFSSCYHIIIFFLPLFSFLMKMMSSKLWNNNKISYIKQAIMWI